MRENHRLLIAGMLAALHSFAGLAQAKKVDLHAGAVSMHVELDPLRYSFNSGRRTVLAAANHGIEWGDEAVRATPVPGCSSGECGFKIATASGLEGTLEITLTAHRAKLVMRTKRPGDKLEFLTAGLAPGYGLGDDSITHNHLDTDITGFSNDHLLADGGLVRFVSNFIIYPRQGVAVVLVDPNEKIVHSSASEIVEGVVRAKPETEMNYFFGDPHQIYEEFLRVRNADHYPVLPPKFALFGLGWEAFGALGWNTSQKTSQENVDRYRAEGYPLTWAEIGSGFWPKEKPFHATTSFGLFDPEKYPDPAGLFRHFHEEGMKVLLGLRICFVIGGPFTQQGFERGYFLSRNGVPEVYHGDWPESPYYMLDAHNPAALAWYLDLVKRWTKSGVDGFKEDLYGYTVADTRDDKVNPINDALMRDGIYVIERTGYLASNGDLIRINDFNYDQNQDRGPVNSLALAYSGTPLLFPTTVGGTFAESKFPTARTHAMQMYMMRIAQWAAVHCGMAMGEPPWSFPDPEVARVMLRAAQMHARLQPYLYSQATRFAEDGYPWPMTPLPIAFPDDPAVYGRENDHVHGYEWMIGDALLAVPLYGNDYATAMSRDVYLPRGRWMAYDSGEIYQGPLMLHNFAMPFEKTPLFVGGSGVVLERVEGRDVVRVYPLAAHARAELHTDGTAKLSVVEVAVKDWKSPHVIDSATKQSVPGSWERHAYQFALEPGHSYRVE